MISVIQKSLTDKEERYLMISIKMHDRKYTFTGMCELPIIKLKIIVTLLEHQMKLNVKGLYIHLRHLKILKNNKIQQYSDNKDTRVNFILSLEET